MALFPLIVTHGHFDQLCQLCPVLWLVDDEHHHPLLVPRLPGDDVPGCATTHWLCHPHGPINLGSQHVGIHLLHSRCSVKHS